MTDIVAARDLAHRLTATVAAADRPAPLVVGQIRLAPELELRAWARSRPSLARTRINSVSNSAIPLKTVSIKHSR